MKTPKVVNVSLKSMLVSLLILWVYPHEIKAGNVAQSPLFISLNLDPNIMFILDDSGSMEWSYLPDSISGFRDRKRAKSSAYNFAYYNPSITYIPPMYADGTSLGNSNFSSAWKNGYAVTGTTAASSSHTVSTANPTVNLGSQFRPTWSNPDDYGDSAQRGYYYQFTPGLPNCGGGVVGDKNDEDCYTKKQISSANDAAGIAERQNFANWYSYYRNRFMMAKAGISRAFATLGATPRVGYGSINKGTSSGIDGVGVNTIERGVRAFTGTNRTAFFTWLFAKTTVGTTPLRRALDSVGAYYSNENPIGPWSSTPGTNGGVLLPCRQSFTVLMTDGYWNGSVAGTSGATKNNDGSTINNMTILNEKGVPYTYPPTGPFKDNDAGTLADVAMYYWKRDLCPNLRNSVPTNNKDTAYWQHMSLYGIGLGVPTQINIQTAFDAIQSLAPITWPTTNPTDNSTASYPGRIDDLLHAAVNSRGNFFSANDPDEFAQALATSLSSIIDTDASSASAVATSSTRLDNGTQVFQALFNPKDWSGTLIAYNVSVQDGSILVDWDASKLMLNPNDRKIWTLNPLVTSGARGIEFKWANLSSTPVGSSQKDHLNKLEGVNDGSGEFRLNWLRGDQSKEQNVGSFRARTNVLGDIVNSDPVFVGSQDYGYSALPGDEGTKYSAFRGASSYASRLPIIYVGGNDGMLHGFNANKKDSGGGVEQLAYIPNALFPQLSNLTSPSYTHQYYVDGSLASTDVYDGMNWRTLLVGSTGAGGRALFGLDVTNPSTFGASNVLWEYSNANSSDLGWTMTQPTIVKLQDGHWAVIVGNGYNSDNGHAVLFVIDAITGALLQKIDTLVGNVSNKNGLSSPLAVDIDNDLKVDTVYAGDLQGNLWKFNLSGAAGTWVAPTSPFFVACITSSSNCSAANRQPITAKPNIGNVGGTGTDQNGQGVMIYFGTGKYFESGDQIIDTSPQVQTFYGLWDQGVSITSRGELAEQNFIFTGVAGVQCSSGTCQGTTSKEISLVSKNPVCYAANSLGCTASSPLKKGWALSLIGSNNVARGDRVVSVPILRRGALVFSTLVPTQEACKSGGESTLLEIDALTGGEFGRPAFDTDGNGKVDNDDYVMVNGVKYVAAGIDLDIGIHKQPTVVESNGVDYKYLSGSSAKMGVLAEMGGDLPCATNCAGPSAGSNRRSWRQLR
jgi:type IV pilus assembly protein PilY1